MFARIRAEAEEAARREPELAAFLLTTILNHETLESAVAHRVAARLDHGDVPAEMIRQIYGEFIARDPAIGEAFRADILAVADRDPACLRLMEPLLYFKGFHALQTYRLAHALLRAGRRDFALYLQSRASSVFDVDINPAARIGKGDFPRPRLGAGGRRDDGDRGRRLDPAGRDAWAAPARRSATGIRKSAAAC